MSKTRYFKATDGKNTYFRASPTRVYQSLTVEGAGRFDWTLHQDGRGRFPAFEITRQEYVALTALKNAGAARAKAEWQADHPGQEPRSWQFVWNAPRDSFVPNSELPGAAQPSDLEG